MPRQQRVNGSLWDGLSRRLRATAAQMLIPVLGLAALGNMGCATTIAGMYPKLDRRAVCVLGV